MTVDELNNLDTAAIDALLSSVAGSGEWAARVAARHPFADSAALRIAQEVAWAALTEDEWRAALHAHASRDMPAGEPEAQAAAALALQLYSERFGMPFVCAAWTTSAEALLMRVRIRLGNEEAAERLAARDEVRRRVRHRIEQWSPKEVATV